MVISGRCTKSTVRDALLLQNELEVCHQIERMAVVLEPSQHDQAKMELRSSSHSNRHLAFA